MLEYLKKQNVKMSTEPNLMSIYPELEQAWERKMELFCKQ